MDLVKDGCDITDAAVAVLEVQDESLNEQCSGSKEQTLHLTSNALSEDKLSFTQSRIGQQQVLLLFIRTRAQVLERLHVQPLLQTELLEGLFKLNLVLF